MSRYLADRIERDPRIEVMLHSEVRELLGDEVLEAVVVEDNATSERTEVPAKALFVFIGFEPHAEWVEGALELAEDGSIPTGSAVADWALPLETSRGACSPPATSGAERCSGSPRRWARERWRSG